MDTFRYAPEILVRYPSVVGGVMLASGLRNGPSSDELRAEYAAEQEAVRERIGETPLSQLPSLAAWRSVFRGFGLDPTQYRGAAEASYVSLLDPPDVIRKKIARATTDSQRDIVFDEKRLGIFNLLTIYQLLGGESKEQIEGEFAGKGYKEFKAALTERLIATLEPIQRRYHELFADHAALDALLAQGDEQVRPLAVETLRLAKERVGLL